MLRPGAAPDAATVGALLERHGGITSRVTRELGVHRTHVCTWLEAAGIDPRREPAEDCPPMAGLLPVVSQGEDVAPVAAAPGGGSTSASMARRAAVNAASRSRSRTPTETPDDSAPSWSGASRAMSTSASSAVRVQPPLGARK